MEVHMGLLLAVKLDRTDTTLDLSHLAKEAEEEKRKAKGRTSTGIYSQWPGRSC